MFAFVEALLDISGEPLPIVVDTSSHHLLGLHNIALSGTMKY
jgi:hypothetical protein